jgi:hypothetical protein
LRKQGDRVAAASPNSILVFPSRGGTPHPGTAWRITPTKKKGRREAAFREQQRNFVA